MRSTRRCAARTNPKRPPSTDSAALRMDRHRSRTCLASGYDAVLRPLDATAGLFHPPSKAAKRPQRGGVRGTRVVPTSQEEKMRTAPIWASQWRFLTTLVVTGLAIAAWTGTATAAPVFREITVDDTYSFNNSPFCGDDVIVVHDVGRIMTTVFIQPDGTFRLAIHDAAITSTITDTRTGATLTGFYSNVEAVQQKTDPVTGAITQT